MYRDWAALKRLGEAGGHTLKKTSTGASILATFIADNTRDPKAPVAMGEKNRPYLEKVDRWLRRQSSIEAAEAVMMCDTVMVPCPKCQQPVGCKSLSGPRRRKIYDLASAPAAVLSDVNRFAPHACPFCCHHFRVEIAAPRSVPFECTGQYQYRADDRTVRDGAGRVVTTLEGRLRSDDSFMVENAGRMLQVILALSSHPEHDIPGIPQDLSVEVRRLACEAVAAGIDTIGLSEA